MGVILAKFRKEKTTYQLLERLEEKIKSIEEFSISTQERQKRFVGNFLIISIGLYVITFVVFYFLFFPPTWLQRIAYTTPLLMFPIVILFLKRLFAWYYQRKLNKNSVQLNGLRAEKKKIIEKVMDTETYKVAIDILQRFGDSTAATNGQRTNLAAHTPYRPIAAQSSTNSSITPRVPLARQLLTPGAGAKTPAKPSSYQSSPAAQSRTPLQAIANTPFNAQQQQRLQSTPTTAYRAQQLQMQNYQHTPYPIINYNSKGYMEKLVDFLIGDGISSRYGMICKECLQHNGMATLEEYEYSAFRCAFCKTLNPARKLRPIGPKIAGAVEDAQQTVSSSGSVKSEARDSHHSQSDSSSGSDSEATVDVGTKMTAAPADSSSDAEKSPAEKKSD